MPAVAGRLANASAVKAKRGNALLENARFINATHFLFIYRRSLHRVAAATSTVQLHLVVLHRTWRDPWEVPMLAGWKFGRISAPDGRKPDR